MDNTMVEAHGELDREADVEARWVELHRRQEAMLEAQRLGERLETLLRDCRNEISSLGMRLEALGGWMTRAEATMRELKGAQWRAMGGKSRQGEYNIL